MMRSMFSGVSGLRNHQTAMDTISNNIANVNTVGFRASDTSFQDMLSQTISAASAPTSNVGGTDPMQVGLGMNIASISVDQTQGNLQSTGKITDMALQGNGFFILSDGTTDYYSRAGDFNIDANGNLTDPSDGLVVQGWMADDKGNINTNDPVGPIQLPMGQTIAPMATTTVGFSGNLAADTSAKYQNVSMQVTDPDGTHNCQVQFDLTSTGFNTWSFQTVVDPTYATISGGSSSGTISVNENGVVTGVQGSVANENYVIVTPIGGTPIEIDFPTQNEANGGTFTANTTGANPNTGAPQAFNFATMGFVDESGPQTLNAPAIQDAWGNNLNVSFNISSTDGLHYTWTATPTLPAPNCNVTSGGTGTFEYDSTRGIYNVTGGNTVVQSNIAGPPTPPAVTVYPPVLNDNMPYFNTNQIAPDLANVNTDITGGGAWPPALNTSSTYSITLNSTEGQPITTLNTTVTNTAGIYTWSCTAQGGSVTGGSGSLTINAGNQVTGETLANNNTPFSIVLNNGVNINVTIPPGITAAAPVATPEFNFAMSGAQDSSTQFTLPSPTVTVTKVYDSLGNAHNLTTTATKVGNNTWDWSTVDENGNELGNGKLYFNPESGYQSSTGDVIHLDPIGADPMSVTLDFSKVTQGAGTQEDSNGMPISELDSPSQNGYPLGQLEDFNVNSSGQIIGVFSNGMNQDLAQVAVANFTNPAGLAQDGNTLFTQTSNSGVPEIGPAGVDGRGTITPGSTEMSNVDLSQEFTNMIIIERGFQANSKIITTTDEMLQDLVNLKQGG